MPEMEDAGIGEFIDGFNANMSESASEVGVFVAPADVAFVESVDFFEI